MCLRRKIRELLALKFDYFWGIIVIAMQRYFILLICIFMVGCAPSIRRSYIVDNNSAAVRRAIDGGADVNAQTLLSGYGNSASNGSLLIFASKIGSSDVANLLVVCGADINAQGGNGETALLETLKTGNWETAKLLIANGADVKMQNSSGESALIVAAQNNSITLINLLLEKGANINLRSKSGTTALMEAADRNFTDMAKLLIDKGAKINLKDNNNRTALIIAATNNNSSLSKLLIEHGAYTHVKNNHGNTALDIAEEKNYPDVVKILLNTQPTRRRKNRSKLYKKNIAVANFESTPPLSASDAGFITNFFQRALVNTRIFNVLDRNNMDKILAEQGFQQKGCTTADCAVQMGKLLNVQLIVVGTCGKLLSRYILTVDIIDVETSLILASFKEDCTRDTGIEQMVFKLTDEVKKTAY